MQNTTQNITHLSQEEIYKIQNLINQLENKKQEINNEISKLQAQIELQQSQLKEIEEDLKNQGIEDLSQIDLIIQQKQNEIKQWIQEVETFLYQE